MSDIVFVQMPFAAVERPSLALGLFSSALKEAGLAPESIYANISFAERIGLPAYVLVRSSVPSALLGEWIFADSAFGASAPMGVGATTRRQFEVPDEFVDLVARDRGHEDLERLLADLRLRASEFVEDLAAQIVRQRPKVVACTSMFEQHVASVALLQRLKEAEPSIFTVIGGANCAGPMGGATHRAFPAVDFTVTGEFDQYAASFFTALAGAQGDAGAVGPLPPNVLGPADRQPPVDRAVTPAAILADMDRAAVPDYDDYFEQLHSSPISRYVLASLPLETSRGCWWGAKQHCTFCGLNAEGMAFRKKSPARALAEIRGLTSRYRLLRWAAVDNIIDMSYFHSVLPELAADGRRYNFFYETKANLKREHLEALVQAGCRFIQPGIESLHDETLRIMKKGTTACGNVHLLKLCLEMGVTPAWSILCGFPGSDPAWVAEVADELPALFHLPPPEGTSPIRFDRFSPYHQRPDEHGLELEPLPAYRQVYPLPDPLIEDLAYFFREAGGMPPPIAATAQVARAVVARWRAEFWSPQRSELVRESDDGQEIRVRDTRACGTSASHVLRGTAATLLRALEAPVGREGLHGRLRRSTGATLPEAAVAEGLAELVERRLVWRSSTQYVALPTPPPRQPMPEKADAAVGKVDMAKYLVEKVRFKLAFA